MADTLRRGSPRKAKPLPGTMYYKPNKYAGPRRTKSKALIQTTTKTQMRASVKRRASAPAAMRTQHDSDTDSLTSLETSDDQDEDKENRNVKRDGDKEKQDDEDIDEAAAQQAEYERQRAENIRANMGALLLPLLTLSVSWTLSLMHSLQSYSCRLGSTSPRRPKRRRQHRHQGPPHRPRSP